MKQFDVVVVGGGTAGITASLAGRSTGACVALVEREPRLGGDCTFYGCVPSKALLEIAKIVHKARQAAAEGIFARAPEIDFAQIAARQRRIVEEIAADESDERFERVGIAVIHGEAQFLSPHELDVDGERVGGKTFVVATGSEPALPQLDGIDQVPYLTNRTIFELEQLPRRLLVLGGGATGLELAQAFRRFGSDVVVLEMLERLLPNEEPEAGQVLAEGLRGEGVELRLGLEAVAARSDAAGIVLSLEREELRGDALLLAVGRRGSVTGLGLEPLGVQGDDGYISIDRRGRTSVANIFAAGDVTGGLQFTHVAAHEGRVAGLNAAGKRRKIDERVAPWVTFTDPEIAHVGLTEREARERHDGVEVVMYPMSRVDRARIEERPVGFVKLVTARRRLLRRVGGGELVGAQIVGPRAGELIQECALAMQTRCFAGRLTQTIHPYPAATLAVQQAAAQLFPLGRALVESDDSR
jgi:pyruvate/2-oxoglutarate dehydrogenase complex dihydrolipoamide dehydrogenase (E3) component